ncbi:hypothetical protein [Natranaerobius trueperi]
MCSFNPRHPYTWALLRSVPTFKTKDQGTYQKNAYFFSNW